MMEAFGGKFLKKAKKTVEKGGQKALVFGVLATTSFGATPIDTRSNTSPISHKDRIEKPVKNSERELSTREKELMNELFLHTEIPKEELEKKDEFAKKAEFWRKQHSEGGPNHESLKGGWNRLLDTKNKKQSDLEVISEIFEKQGVPKNLVFLALAESYWNKKAYNKGSQAGGPWQFIPATAQRFGLKDRYDIRESTEAACKYLKWLKNLAEKCAKEAGVSVSESDLWYWAFLAYNRGEGYVLERPSGKQGDFFKFGGDINEYIKNCPIKESTGYVAKIKGIEEASQLIFKLKQEFAKK